MDSFTNTNQSLRITFRSGSEEISFKTKDVDRLLSESRWFTTMREVMDPTETELVIPEDDLSTAVEFVSFILSHAAIIASAPPLPWNTSWAKLAVKWMMEAFIERFASSGEKVINMMLARPTQDDIAYEVRDADDEEFNGRYDLETNPTKHQSAFKKRLSNTGARMLFNGRKWEIHRSYYGKFGETLSLPDNECSLLHSNGKQMAIIKRVTPIRDVIEFWEIVETMLLNPPLQRGPIGSSDDLIGALLKKPVLQLAVKMESMLSKSQLCKLVHLVQAETDVKLLPWASNLTGNTLP